MGKKGKKKGGGGGDEEPQQKQTPPAQKDPRPAPVQQGGPSQAQQGGPQKGQGKKKGGAGGGDVTYQQQGPPARQGGPPQQGPPHRQGGPSQQGPPPRQGGPPQRPMGPPPGFSQPSGPTPSGPPTVWGRGRGRDPVLSEPQVRPQTAPQISQQPPAVQQIRPQSQQRVSPPSQTPSPTYHSITPSSSSSSISTGNGKKLESATRQLQDISMSSLQIPLRDKVGSHGFRIPIEINHLSLNLRDPNMKVYHYDVAITPDKPYRLYKKVVDTFQRNKYPNNFFGFDGRKNIFTNQPLDEETVDQFTIRDEEKSCDHKGMDYTIVVTYASEFRMGKLLEYMENGSSLQPPQLMIQALDVVLRHPACDNPRFVSVGRSFFSPPPQQQIVSLGGGLNLWYGFYQSAILGWRPFLNVDVAHKGFPEAVDCVQALINITNADVSKPLENYAYQNFRQYIKNLKVVYEIPGQKNSKRTYKISDLADAPIKKKFIDEKDGNKEVLVSEYFARKKNFRLKYPHLPSLQAGTKTANRDCCLPLELCTIMEGQVSNKKLDEKQTATMVRNAARPTYERKNRIMRSITEVGYNKDKCINQFGISVNTQFEKVDARVIPAPALQYSGQPSRVTQGVWNAGRFITPGILNNWAIVNLDNRTNNQNLDNLYSQFNSNGRNVGINVEKPQMITLRQDRNRDIKILLENTFNSLHKDDVQLVVVVIPPFGEIYGKVKQAAELYSGILTQCLKSRTVQQNLNRATVINILLKVNAKLNGLNHTLIMEDRFNFLRRPIIIMGADVTHPSPDQTEIPSVAAVTASFDVNAFKYNVEWQLQGPRVEIIQDLGAIVKSHLMNFYRKNNKIKPEKIVFYRDGVSEGQFKQVLSEEVLAIRKACSALQTDYQPAITFLVVQKRHHTRFFPNDKDAVGKNKNVPAGTVLDHTITHPKEKDFYLNSHASIQGTSRPTKYHVLWDDEGRSMDDLEMMTYYLCHLFTRCTRAISYPAPTYYAHLAAFRIRAYCEGRSMRFEDLKNEKLLAVQKRVSSKFPMFFV